MEWTYKALKAQKYQESIDRINQHYFKRQIPEPKRTIRHIHTPVHFMNSIEREEYILHLK